MIQLIQNFISIFKTISFEFLLLFNVRIELNVKVIDIISKLVIKVFAIDFYMTSIFFIKYPFDTLTQFIDLSKLIFQILMVKQQLKLTIVDLLLELYS
jgi:hypothetical protein